MTDSPRYIKKLPRLLLSRLRGGIFAHDGISEESLSSDAEHSQEEHQEQNVENVSSINLIPELEDEIFEHAAYMYPSFAPTLSIISRRVQARIELVIYKTLVLRRRTASNRLHRVLDMAWTSRIEATLLARPAEFFAKNVRNVTIDSTVSDRIKNLVFQKCTRIENLGLWCGRDFNFVVPLSHTIRTLFTTRLVANDLAASGVVFPRLTYLALQYLPRGTRIANLNCFPALTTVQLDIGRYIYVHNEPWLEDVKTVISSVSDLESLVLNVAIPYMDDARVQLETVGDARILVRDDDVSYDGVGEWRRVWSSRS